MAYKISTPKAKEQKSFVLSDEEKYEILGRLNDKQLRAYSDFRFEGFKHKTALELAETL